MTHPRPTFMVGRRFIKENVMTDTNTDHLNTGYWNTGNWNTGDRNTGNWNTGYWNTGDRNTGYWNTGNWNTGDRNTGDWNTGHRNTGDRNTGHRNTGDRNTGNWNTGHRNTGDWNTGHRNTGCFNTKTPEGGYFFNKWLAFDEWEKAYKPNLIFIPSPTTWVPENEMTDQEKIDNPTFHTCGGYIRINDMKDEWRKAYESASEDDIQMVRELPNFDADVFEEITGLDLRVKTDTCDDKIVLIDGKKYKLTEV